MFNYSGQSCIDSSDIQIISGTTLLISGNIVGSSLAGGAAAPTNCYSIIGEADSGLTPTLQYSVFVYDTCLECFEDNDLGFEFEDCQTSEQIGVSAASLGFVPTPSYIYEMCFSGVCSCYTSTIYVDARHVNLDPQQVPVYVSCDDCLPSLAEFPRTGGTEYTVCVICCPCLSGATVTSVVVPHPVWTDNRGIEVIQASAVQLGGQNGLYM